MHRLLDRVVRGMGAPGTDAVELVFNRWDEVVGRCWPPRPVPPGLERGRLVLVADDPAVVSHVRWLEPQLLERLAELLGAGRVTGIDVRVTRRAGGAGAGPDRPGGPGVGSDGAGVHQLAEAVGERGRRRHDPVDQRQARRFHGIQAGRAPPAPAEVDQQVVLVGRGRSRRRGRRGTGRGSGCSARRRPSICGPDGRDAQVAHGAVDELVGLEPVEARARWAVSTSSKPSTVWSQTAVRAASSSRENAAASRPMSPVWSKGSR